MAQNPLEQFFRQPKIFINLPSQGIYNQPGTIQGDAANLPVYGMTGMDEIITRTPDALFTGESTVRVVQSCVPNIKDPWDISSIDADLIFAAIRIATYGEKLSIVHTCSKCETENAYDINLNGVVEHFASCQFDSKLVMSNITVNIRPMTYKQMTEINMRNYQLQRKMSQVDAMETGEEKQELIQAMFHELATIQTDFLSNCIESVDTGKLVVTEKPFIKEWIIKCDKNTNDAIREQIVKNQDAWQIPKFPVICSEEACLQEDKINLMLDQSNFFVQA